MKIKIDKISETKREMEVIIPVEEMKPYLEKAAQKISGEMKVKGFRPGHVPSEVVENSVGKERVFEEAAKEAVHDTYPKAIKENGLFAVSAPKVDLVKCAPENDVVYKATVYVLPEIKLPDYKTISEKTLKKEKKEVDVREEEVKKAIESIRETRAKLQKVNREAKKGDSVTINFKGVFGQSEDKKIDENNFQMVLGRGDMALLEGFEEKILGMKEGEKKSFSVTVPEVKPLPGEEGKKALSGEKINFDVEMVSVMERELPELGEDFAKSFPDTRSVEELKEKIKEGIKKDKEAREKEGLKIKIMENIIKETSFEVPEVLTEKELDNMIKTVEDQLAQKGSTFEQYLQETGKTEEDLRKEWRKKAEKNVAYALLLHAISEEEKIEVKDEEIEKELDKHFALSGRKKEEEKEENLKRAKAYIHDVIKNRKVFRALSIEE